MTLDALVEAVREAHDSHTPLRLRGHGSKDFYGGLLAGEILPLADYRGVVAYEPTELFVTARCGTPLAELERTLAERGQMLACEPPHFSGATVGGMVAAGLSGPRRPHAGAVRDFVLGVKLIDGTGQVLDFGGQVMKNVAGYDVSRFVAGSLGTLGLLAEVSLKVLPRPAAEATLAFELDAAETLVRLNAWGGQPLPLSGSFWHDGRLHLRLAGAEAAVAAARRSLGGEVLSEAAAGLFWHTVREQTHAAFAGPVLWRLSVPSTAPVLDLPLEVAAMEWGGALRWLAGEADGVRLRDLAGRAGGHATLYRAPESQRCREAPFAPLPGPLLALHRRLKKAFDPRGILNPGRLYAEF